MDVQSLRSVPLLQVAAAIMARLKLLTIMSRCSQTTLKEAKVCLAKPMYTNLRSS